MSNDDDLYQPVNVLSVMVTTAPRPIPTLVRTIKSMREAGFTDTINICNDGRTDIPSMYSTKVLNKDKMGGLKSWVWSLNWLQDMTHAKWLMVCEDDVVWTRNCVPTLLQELQKADANSVGYISLYAPRVVTKRFKAPHPLPPGYYESHLGWSTWGSQCLIFPRPTADRLLSDPEFHGFVASHVKNKNRDAVVSKFIQDYKLQAMYRIPCFVDHIGAGNSAYGNAPKAGLETDYFVEAIT